MPTMNVELRAGQSVKVSGAATIELIQKSGQRARLRIVVPEGESIQPPVESGIASVVQHGLTKRTSPPGD
mgnify:CR=1 FL=1